ncbi:MAG: endonuclease MutS2 [Chloroflexi bacterium]|uniref:endonuclease MutS2 n=1 Tax=Candidatus Flexifilum breve TaxID=3140694 RepID=UPI0031376268|nr:endonuclease MutS2 [Chloroflexota bacterium]
MNEKTVNVLELPKILARLAGYCTFSAGAELARDLRPTTDIYEAQLWQKETAEARLMFANQFNASLGGARDVREAAMAATRGVMIEAQVLLDIKNTLRRALTLKRTLGRMKGTYPLLSDHANEAEECAALQEEIGRVLDEGTGMVKDSASPQLATIRRDMKVAFDRLQTKLQRIIGSSTNQVLLQDALITMRNGRYVVPLKSEHKGKIPGVVHDSSASGATLFIEPLETLELNNRWRELQLDEEKEVRRILLMLTERVAEDSERIVRTVEVLANLDLILAKALYADDLKAVEPALVPFQAHHHNPAHPGSTIYMWGARHPLLSGNVVPIDIDFDENTWVLVVTGPNTGGKTVSLKTVGLLTLMAQCGLHLPCEKARVSVFEGVYADIGDEQSIEQSLSTFSSHMTNTIHILRECDEHSLVLLDELGAGTDPAEGSALARAILTHLKDRKVTTMVTTHHPELKVYSVETPGVRNASVEFDLETLAPTYRLIIGLPGRSNALAIAKRLGLNDEILEEARGMVAIDDLIADDLLDEIHRTREDIRRQQQQITEEREAIEAAREELHLQLSGAEDERRNIIAAARRSMQQEMEDFRKEVRRLRGDLRDASLPLEKLREVQMAGDALDKALNQPVEASPKVQQTDITWIPRLGDAVWLDALKAEGTVIELDKDDAVVQVGSLKVRAKIVELKKPTRSEKKALKKKYASTYESDANVTVPKGVSPGLELDLRGTRVEEALARLDDYIDAAYLSGIPFGRIIHGKGTGALRKAVQERVGEHPLISKAVGAPPKEGGDGVTIIYMVPPT